MPVQYMYCTSEYHFRLAQSGAPARRNLVTLVEGAYQRARTAGPARICDGRCVVQQGRTYGGDNLTYACETDVTGRATDGGRFEGANPRGAALRLRRLTIPDKCKHATADKMQCKGQALRLVLK